MGPRENVRAAGRRRRGARALVALTVTLGLACPDIAGATELCEAPWRHLPETGREVIRPVPLALLGTAAVSPIFLIPTNADYELRKFAQTDLGGSYEAEKVSLYTPYVLFPSLAVLYAGSVFGNWCPGQKPTAAILQATTLTAITYGLTKIITGRRWPVWYLPEDLALDDPSQAREFTPFQRVHEELGAFPSGHTAFMFAAAAALRTSSPEFGLWRYVGYPLAAGMGFAMWFGDYHWASDILSGALLGEAIGSSVGRAFAPRPAADPTKGQVTWIVLPAPGGAAVSFAGSF